MSNIALLLGDRLHAMFITRRQSNPDKITSISFGTGIECCVDRHRMRYCIDYYGEPNCDVIKGHVFKHYQEIRSCLERSKVATHVIVYMFMPKVVRDVIDGEEIMTFVEQEMGFGEVPADIRDPEEQCVGDSEPRALLRPKGKL